MSNPMKALVILGFLLLSGCAEFNALKSAVGSYGSGAADEAVDVAIWQLCNAASVGSIERRFQTEEQQAARNTLCND